MANDTAGADIFLSYAGADQERAEYLAKALVEKGWSVFWDRNVPAGHTWDDYIGAHLDAARCVLVAWSKASVQSEWVREEAREGRERKSLVPVLFEQVRPPFGFRGIQWADLSAWDGRNTASAFQQLVVALSHKLGPPPEEAEGQRGAQELQRQNKLRDAHRAPGAQPHTDRAGEHQRQLAQPHTEAHKPPADEEQPPAATATPPSPRQPSRDKGGEPARRSWQIGLGLAGGVALDLLEELESPRTRFERRSG